MEAQAQDYQPVEIYRDLRKMVLTTYPRSAAAGLPGLLMESGYPGAVVTLIALEDGTVSIYFSSGGGILGLGPHEGVARVREKLLALAPSYVQQAAAATEYPLPKQDFTRFYFLTPDGVRASEEIRTDDLGHQRHALSPLFHQAHELIYESRLVEEKQKAGQKP